MEKNKGKNKVIVILGSTSSGKTGLGVALARKFGGEIISADSRQVYTGMDVGTGKDLAEYGSGKDKVKYHLIDVISPKKTFDLASYQKLAYRAIEETLARGHKPFLVGGTGLYLQAVVDNYQLSRKQPSKKIRQELEKLNKKELFERITKLNPEFAKKINQSDRNNPRRLLRYLEIILLSEDPLACGRGEPKYDFLVLGLDWPKEFLEERIKRRLLDRLEKQNMIEEAKRLHAEGLSYRKMENFGLEYKFLAKYLKKEINYNELVEQLGRAICQFAKRQKTWWRRWERQGRKIVWVKELKEAEKVIKKFLKA